ncbi:hypothetical protein HY485_00250 [Candidatus Woesearchaeota archaeon]|nr:hypothetical protein [Candidatus Woesearchaeota archaeon]
METVCVKFEDGFARDIEQAMKKHRYVTKTEFIREAVRDKLSEFEKEEIIRRVKSVYGASKRKTTDEQLHAAREKAVQELEKEFGL